MVEGPDTTAADKLKDIIEDLRRGKRKKSDVNEYEDEFQDSFEQLSEKGEDENPTSEAATAHINSYLNYTADNYRLAARNVWDSVLLYDKEYRRKQSDESFEWGSYRQDLRDFQLVIKQITIQCMHFRKRQLEHLRTLDRRRMNVPKARFYLMAEKFVEALITILVSVWIAE
jgi:hypothetical protein